MNKLIFAGIIAFLGISLYAQPGPSEKNPVDMATRMTNKMTEALNLTEDQAARVYDINMDFATEMIEADATRKQIHYAHREDLSAVLTKEQMQKLDHQMNKRRAMHKHKQHERESVPEELQKE